jgi:hypothetical protein
MPTIFQIFFTVKRINGKSSLSLFSIFLLTVFLGLILPIAASFISMYGFTYGMNSRDSLCVTGITAFMFYGIGMNIILTPIIGIAGTRIQYFKFKRQNTSSLQ